MEIQILYQLFLKHPSISTDSRNIYTNSIYFALKGELFNGNKFALEALEKGAAYAIVDEINDFSDDRIIEVKNALECLQNLANYHRNQFNIPIIGITGTNGKTTTKELIAAVLSKKFNIIYTLGNLNNHIGVPLTLLRIQDDTEIAIVEMGANHLLEIKNLCEIAEPNLGLITNIGNAHLDGFGSFEGVKKAKGELYDHLKKTQSTIFVNESNLLLAELLENYTNVIKYGCTNSQIIGNVVKSDPFVLLNYKKQAGGDVFIQTQLAGIYNLENILASIAIGIHFSVDENQIKDALEVYKPENNRSQVIYKNKNTLFVDCYNANPSSMKASIENFVSLNYANKLLILGDMFELGESSEIEHSKILDLINLNHLSPFTILVGNEFKNANKFNEIREFNNVQELIEYFKNIKLINCAILLKGSRGMKLERILDSI